MRHRGRVPGCIFINNGRYWWRVKLPGERELRARPLVPVGGQFATNDIGAAEEIARNTYAQAVFRSGGNGNGDGRKAKKDHFDGTVAAVVRTYMDHCRGYYLKPDGWPAGSAARCSSPGSAPCGCPRPFYRSRPAASRGGGGSPPSPRHP